MPLSSQNQLALCTLHAYMTLLCMALAGRLAASATCRQHSLTCVVKSQAPHFLNVDLKSVLPASTYDEAPSPSPLYQKGRVGFALDAPGRAQQPSRLAGPAVPS